ncbi:hypothetical protein [Hydrogenobaculum acidophilum]
MINAIRWLLYDIYTIISYNIGMDVEEVFYRFNPWWEENNIKDTYT